ncbi:type III toxin-antitoxin system TenpIN family toxin [Oceanospirillum beijerinckii]|uniref:type III toxin-antitoxin system TenpIN family toxin n=1 Tax=Oceanospirillum beijerinckii TaxID=64976 RepID=UPI000406F836|nr:hypothetical protein [Oceanospirillum beijerinckii]
MQLKKLDASFYLDHTHLKEALDNREGSWEVGKTRGYGVVIISINDLTFAIPLRSNIRHSAAYITVRGSQNGVKGKGLDFSKALLITDEKYISAELFKTPSAEHTRLMEKEHFVTQKFEKYVQKYIKAMARKDRNILNSPEFRYSTLINYHAELGVL